MTLRVSPDAPSAVASSSPGTGYRHDLDGLRALAVLLIVAYHVWVGRVSGGVDVFLMLSAFFLTASFVRRAEATAPLRLRAYWTKTFKRLIPAAAVVLLAVLAVSWTLLPATRWPSIWDQTWASLFYFQNWELAGSAVDYYARHDDALSPLQHFWSMSIQGQIFVLWPLLITGGYALARVKRLPARRVLLVVFVAVFVASLAYSVFITSADQRWAYFDTGARLWEFALGSIAALVLPMVRLPEVVATTVGWLGLVGIAFCGILLDVQGGFPGYLALWPTLCAAALIFAGSVPTRFGAHRLLSLRPLRRLGESSYSLYLVHWPLLVIWIVAIGRPPGLLAGAGIIVGSILAAVVLHRLVEQPLRRWSWGAARLRHGAAVIVVSALAVALPTATWQLHSQVQAHALIAAGDHPGAVALDPLIAGEFTPVGDPAPAATLLDAEWVSLPEPCTGRFATTDPRLADSCAQSVVSGEVTATIVVVGDSHSEQMMGALLPIAERSGWQLVSVLKGGCSFGVGGKCPEWGEATLDYILDVAPDAVFSVGTAASPDGPFEKVTPGFEEAALVLADRGVDVIAVRDNPRFAEDKYECGLRESMGAEHCAVPRRHALAAENPLTGLGAIDGVHLVDFTGELCPAGDCQAIIGNVFVYLDDNHLTGTFATSLSSSLEAQLAGVLH